MERAGLIGAVRMRKLETDEKGSLRGPTLQAAILEDKAKGLLPFFVSVADFSSRRHADTQTDRQTDKYTQHQSGKQTERPTDRPTDTQ